MAKRVGVLATYEHPEPRPVSEWLDEHARTHPGLAESLVPVWGSAREAVADAYDGDYAGAVGNGVLAAVDLIPGTAMARTGTRTVKYLEKFGPLSGRTADWKAVRHWMGQQGYAGAGQPVHHLIEKNGALGKQIPDWLKNSPLNTMPMSDAVTHGRLHGKYLGLPQFNVAERVSAGTPKAVKAAAQSTWGSWAHGAKRRPRKTGDRLPDQVSGARLRRRGSDLRGPWRRRVAPALAPRSVRNLTGWHHRDPLSDRRLHVASRKSA